MRRDKYIKVQGKKRWARFTEVFQHGFIAFRLLYLVDSAYWDIDLLATVIISISTLETPHRHYSSYYHSNIRAKFWQEFFEMNIGRSRVSNFTSVSAWFQSQYFIISHS